MSVPEKVEGAVPILAGLHRVPKAVSESQARPDSEGGFMDPSPASVGVRGRRWKMHCGRQ